MGRDDDEEESLPHSKTLSLERFTPGKGLA